MSVLVSEMTQIPSILIPSTIQQFSVASSHCSSFQRLCWILLQYLQKLLQSPTYTTMMFYLVKIRHFIYGQLCIIRKYGRQYCQYTHILGVTMSTLQICLGTKALTILPLSAIWVDLEFSGRANFNSGYVPESRGSRDYISSYFFIWLFRISIGCLCFVFNFLFWLMVTTYIDSCNCISI